VALDPWPRRKEEWRGEGISVFLHIALVWLATLPRWHGDVSSHINKNGKNSTVVYGKFVDSHVKWQ